MMTKKGFEGIAKVFNDIKPIRITPLREDNMFGEMRMWLICSHAIADLLKKENPRFDYDIFFKQCEDKKGGDKKQ